ncbi:MAG TPA: HWE histidine kinase domain-containing protein [Azospirillaceae bacterium]|nr:HWE histidine kinase domain-containing protein [Azospirillaceae bacterium]
MLTVACALPSMLVAGVLQLRAYHDGVENVQQQILGLARALRLAVDRELESETRALVTLVTSPSLQAGDFEAFRRQADEFLRDQPAGSSLLIFDADGQQLFNSLVPAGVPLPRRNNTDTVGHVFGGGRPHVTGVYRGRVSGQLVISIEAPVIRAGQVVYGAALSLPPSQFQEILRRQRIPAGWTVSVFDPSRRHVARLPAPERFLEKPGAESLQRLMANGGEGAGETITLEGVPSFTAYSFSEVSGWSVAIGVPRSILQEPLLAALVRTSVIGLLVLALGAGIAAWLAGRIVRPLTSLADFARRLARGETVERPQPIGMQEVDDTVDALVAGASALGGFARSPGIYMSLLEIDGTDIYYLLPNANLAAFFGCSVEELKGKRLSEVALAADEVRRWTEKLIEVVESGQSLTHEYGFRDRWYLTTYTPVAPGPEGRSRLTMLTFDITERRQAEERQRLLMREVDHRAKNVLAVVMSLVRLSRADEPAAFVAAVEGRVAALARAHSLLAETRWNGGGLAAIIGQEVAPHADRGQVSLVGPHLMIQPDSVQPLSMIFHELWTNSAKYGALSASGVLRVDWVQDAAMLNIVWTETGGPVLAGPPPRRGFGTTLIDASVTQLDGQIEKEWAREGLVCRIRIPSRHVLTAQAGPGPSEDAPAVPGAGGARRGERILVVEDNAILNLSLTRTLTDLGWKVLSADTLERGMELARTARIDAAVLDMDLRGESSTTIAEVLAERDIGFVFATGFTLLDHAERWSAVPVVRKPYTPAELTAALAYLEPAGEET